jgi:non-specific serine/threonine protein kinase/protein-serine/threonine kinase
VRLTARAHKIALDGQWEIFKRWRAMRNLKAFAPPPAMAAQIERAPILLVAVDLSPEMEPLSQAIYLQVKRMLVNRPDARVACVNVIKTAMLGIDQTTDNHGTNLHVARLVALKGWADGIDLTDDRMTYTILENTDPAAAIIEHADANRVDHILMGARGHSTTRRFLGSVSAKVVAEASCSVTVIRLREAVAAEDAA